MSDNEKRPFGADTKRTFKPTLSNGEPDSSFETMIGQESFDSKDSNSPQVVKNDDMIKAFQPFTASDRSAQSEKDNTKQTSNTLGNAKVVSFRKFNDEVPAVQEIQEEPENVSEEPVTRNKPAKAVAKEKKTSRSGGTAILGVSCVILIAAVGVMGMTLLKNNAVNDVSIPSVGGAISVAKDDQSGNTFTEQAPQASDLSITSDGRNWKMHASFVRIEGENGASAVVAVDTPDAFQYNGKSLVYEQNGATYIVRIVSGNYDGAAQYSEENTSENTTVSGILGIGNGQVLVVVGTSSTSADSVKENVIKVLESACPAADTGVVTLNGVSVMTEGYDVTFNENLALVKSGDSEIQFVPSTYQANEIGFDTVGETSNGATVSHGDYADTDSVEGYLIESDSGKVMAFTNNSDTLTAVLGLQ